MPELSDFPTLQGEIRVFDGSLSKTQFEEIWDKIEERIDSDLVPDFSIVDDGLNINSRHPVENQAITEAISRLYTVFPTHTVSGTSGHYAGSGVTLYDGANGIPLSSFSIEFGPIVSESGFEEISELPSIEHSYGSGGTQAGEMFNYTFDPLDKIGLYAGRLTETRLYYYKYYESYNGEDLVGPWASSEDEYEEGSTPTIGASVIDYGTVSKTLPLGSDLARQLATKYGENSYNVGDDNSGTPCRGFSITYRSDPDLYVVQAVGLTEEQKSALIALLDD